MRLCKKCGAPAGKGKSLLCSAHERERIRNWARTRRAKDPEHDRRYKAANRLRIRALERARRVADPRRALLAGAKQRAQKLGVPFSLKLSDIKVPVRCPLLGVSLAVGSGKQTPQSPTLDRIFNERGYVAGNVVVISHAANTCKGGLRAEQIARVARNLAVLERNACS